MMNPTYHFARMRERLEDFEPSRERSLAQTKLDEAELWLTRCTPTVEAVERDGTPRTPRSAPDLSALLDHATTALHRVDPDHAAELRRDGGLGEL